MDGMAGVVVGIYRVIQQQGSEPWQTHGVPSPRLIHCVCHGVQQCSSRTWEWSLVPCGKLRRVQ